MIWVYKTASETERGEILRALPLSGFKLSDEIFVLKENDAVFAAGALRFNSERNGAEVLDVAFIKEENAAYRDMLIRAVLNTLRDTDTAVTGRGEYYKSLGFESRGNGKYETTGNKIIFNCACNTEEGK